MTERRTQSRGAFGLSSLTLGGVLLVCAVFFVLSVLGIASRVHQEQASQIQSGSSAVAMRFEVHDYALIGMAFQALHVWVLWAGAWFLFRRVVRHKTGGLILVGCSILVLAVGHAVIGWLGDNGVYIGVPGIGL